MIRLILFFILLVHGLIHLLGFVKEYKLMEVSQLNGKTLIPVTESNARIFGFLWLLAALLVVGTALLYLLGKSWWWQVGAMALLVSQAMIVLYWQDARAGTIANLILLVAVVLAGFRSNFDHAARLAADSLLETVPTSPGPPIAAAQLDSLPAPVKRWLSQSGIVGQPPIRVVRLRQNGSMCTKQGGKWMNYEASQYVTPFQPAFVWKAAIQAFPGVELVGLDQYREGKGNMRIRILSAIPVADSKGPEIDQGTLLRYLGEIVWCPSAALLPYVQWEAVDEHNAKATMQYGGISATGLFSFDESGDPVGFEAQRYGEFEGVTRLENWQVRSSGHRAINGVRVPTYSEVTWKLAEGDFTWLKLNIEAIDFDQPGRKGNDF